MAKRFGRLFRRLFFPPAVLERIAADREAILAELLRQEESADRWKWLLIEHNPVWREEFGHLLTGSKRNRFFPFFTAGEYLDELARERMQAWKDHMLDEVEGPTVACYVKQTKTVFNWAKSQGWIEKSPLTGVSVESFINKKKDRIVPMTDYRRLLEACPCLDWRVIISLTRIGGLRCPSEVLRLRWEDVDWERGCFLVRSPKTEHHEGKEGRTVPIFPELKEELERLFFDPKSEGKEFVINRYRSEKQNLRTTLEKIFNRAKLPTIPKPFDNFRMTRSNEVYNRWGAFKESQWIGHSSRVRADHYLMMTDADYLETSQWESRAASTDRPKRKRAELAGI